MAERDSPDDLFPFAQALVRTLLKENGLRWSSHRVDDAEQDLFLAGWQVYQDEGTSVWPRTGWSRGWRTCTATTGRNGRTSPRQHRTNTSPPEFRRTGNCGTTMRTAIGTSRTCL